MNLPVSKPEYSYQTADAGHHHDYLLKPLMEMIFTSTKKVEGRKCRILDIGCGNGSFLWKSMLVSATLQHHPI